MQCYYNLQMGNTHRQKDKYIGRSDCMEIRNKLIFLRIIMVTAKVIFLLHCTGLAQLSFYASLVEAYNFTICNHTAIKTDYRNMLQNIIAEELSKANNINTNIKNCCTLKSQAELFGCIYNFTKAKFSASGIWNFTNTLLKKHCYGNSRVNGSQNHRWTRLKSCNKRLSLNNLSLLELREMWNSYEAYTYQIGNL